MKFDEQLALPLLFPPGCAGPATACGGHAKKPRWEGSTGASFSRVEKGAGIRAQMSAVDAGHPEIGIILRALIKTSSARNTWKLRFLAGPCKGVDGITSGVRRALHFCKFMLKIHAI